MTDTVYTKPYIEAAVFIAWIRGREIEFKELPDGTRIDQGQVSEYVLKQAEDGIFPVVSSYLTIAEVFKKKGSGLPSLNDDENGRILKYFENEFITFVEVDRIIAEDANRLCRQFRDKKLCPNDAIHLASALRAGCDVLLTWDSGLVSVVHPGIRIEYPRILGQVTLPLAAS